MIYITHNKSDNADIDQLLHKMGVTKLFIDKSEIDQDIERLNSKRGNTAYRRHRKEIDKLVRYLEKAKERVGETGETEFVWSIVNHGVSSYPIKLLSIPELGINMADYVKPQENEKMCTISYREVLQIIAADMMYRDLGYSTEDMEERLLDVGITGVYPANRLLKIFDEDDILALSNLLKIGDTQYKSLNANRYKCYFNTDDELSDIKTSYYKDIVNPSCKIAMSLLSNSVFNILNKASIQFKLVSVTNSGICIIVSDKDVDRIPKEHAIVRAFGRLFEVIPNLTIF